MTQPEGIWRKASMLAIGGGLAFWLANFAISRTPIAADYRAALSISLPSMLLEALIGGLIVGFCVSYLLLRFFDKLPTNSPMTKSVVLTLGALIVVTVLVEVPAKLFTTTSDPLRYFLIGAVFNGLRFLALGVAIGFLFSRLNGLRRQ